MAKNFNLKVKNSQLAAMLKQKETKAKEGISEQKKLGDQKATVVPTLTPIEEKKKNLRKAKAGPTMHISEKVEEVEEIIEIEEEFVSVDLNEEQEHENVTPTQVTTIGSSGIFTFSLFFFY